MGATTDSHRIVRVSARLHACPLLRPFVTAQRRTEAVAYAVCEVELADGTVGQGTAAETVAVTGESAESVVANLSGPLRVAVEGVTGTPDEFAELARGAVEGASSARGALDVAVWDAVGKAEGRPVVELLGGSFDPEAAFDSDMTVSLEEPETMARHAREAVAAGYRILKVKLGGDTAEDVERLHAVVAAEPGVTLRIDANQGWSPEGAVRMLETMRSEGLPIEVVEQPVAKADLAGMALVRRDSPFPIMADESLWTAADARRVIDAGAADMLNIKLAKTGSLGEGLRIARLAEDAGLTCMVGAMMEPKIGITAAAHLAFANPSITMVDLDPPAWFASQVPAGGMVDDGRLRLLGGPGLGLEMLRPEDDPHRG